ncbi:MAG: hypothetical protein Q7S40_09280 [Opitutaceae bacterium]|nr:hypothetical protein [Opitutaceae bacterium]
MKKRIGLFTPVARKKKNGPTTTTSYVEVSAAAELAEKLTALGAKRVGLLCRDRLGTTRMEGSMFAVGDLKDEHVDWVTTKAPEFETRGIFYDAKP